MPAKILFVDDDEENLVVCEAHCGRDFDVLTCSNAEQALQLLAEHEVGVIVADQRMPGTTGVELLERVRIEYPDTVRLLITAYADLNAAVGAINRGQVRRYIRKPWEAEDLKAELHSSMELYEMSGKLRAMSARLRETERVYSLGIIAASVAHELRNPVSWVYGNLRHIRMELAKVQQSLDEAGTAEPVAEKFQEIEDALNDAQVGIDRIMEIVRGIELPNRQSDSPEEAVDLDSVIRLSLKLVAGEVRHCTEVRYQPEVRARTSGSQTKIGQIVLNLIVNAIQALAEPGPDRKEIRIALGADTEWAYLTVSDSGQGIPEEARSKVFDPFYTTKKQQGTGLGLAISQQIATELGGTLGVDADPELGGARFRLKLPLLR